MPYVRRTKRRKSVSRRLKIAALSCLVLATALVLGGLYTLQQERIQEATAEAANFTPAPVVSAEPDPTAVFLGDSYTEGGSGGTSGGFAGLTAESMGWTPVNMGQGATGYLTDGPEAFPEREPIVERADDVVELSPEVVVVAAGLNDAGRGYTEAQMRNAVAETFTTIQSGLPDAEVYIVGPFWPNGFPTDSVLAVRDAVKAEAEEAGLPFIDPIAGEWIIGSADGAIEGNRTEYISEDGVHPTPEGHAYLAEKLAEAIRSL